MPRWRASKPKPDGSPDVEAWLEAGHEEAGISLDIYRNDLVWSSVALKKLVGDKIASDRGRSPEGLRSELRGARAVPGDRAEQSAPCPAGLRDGQEKQHERELRRAGEPVLGRARQPGAAGRGAADQEDTAASRTWKKRRSTQAGRAVRRDPGRRQVHHPPLRRTHQAGPVDFADVRDEIYRDLHEKKLRVAMAGAIRESAGGGHRRQLSGQHQPFAEAVQGDRRPPTCPRSNRYPVDKVRKHALPMMLVVVAIVLLMAGSVHAADAKTAGLRRKRPRKGS